MAERLRRPMVAGNWKLNGLSENLCEISTLCDLIVREGPPDCELVLCPPATLIDRARTLLANRSSGVLLGGQDCHSHVSGAHTGDISAEMLADAGANAVLVGHSERRTDHREVDAEVRDKAIAAHRAGLLVIVCVGETLEQRDAGATVDVVTTQITGSLPVDATAANTVIAYEPVWAIGTGRTPSVADVANVHTAIRDHLVIVVGAEAANAIRVLYGGSVKPSNAAELMGAAHVDGALVGGASLKAADFWGIAKVY